MGPGVGEFLFVLNSEFLRVNLVKALIEFYETRSHA